MGTDRRHLHTVTSVSNTPAGLSPVVVVHGVMLRLSAVHEVVEEI